MGGPPYSPQAFLPMSESQSAFTPLPPVTEQEVEDFRMARGYSPHPRRRRASTPEGDTPETQPQPPKKIRGEPKPRPPQKSDGTCFRCKQPGHWKNECPNRRPLRITIPNPAPAPIPNPVPPPPPPMLPILHQPPPQWTPPPPPRQTQPYLRPQEVPVVGRPVPIPLPTPNPGIVVANPTVGRGGEGEVVTSILGAVQAMGARTLLFGGHILRYNSPPIQEAC